MDFYSDDLPPLLDIHEVSRIFMTYIQCELGSGDDGTVYLLGNGLVIKHTYSVREIALALEIMDYPVRGLPDIYGVYTNSGMIYPDDSDSGYPYKNMFIIRENISDICMNRDMHDDFLNVMNGITNRDMSDIIKSKDMMAIEEIKSVFTHAENRFIFNEIIRTQFDLHARTGSVITDIFKLSNLGVAPDGKFVIRDFSRPFLRSDILQRGADYNNDVMDISPEAVRDIVRKKSHHDRAGHGDANIVKPGTDL